MMKAEKEQEYDASDLVGTLHTEPLSTNVVPKRVESKMHQGWNRDGSQRVEASDGDIAAIGQSRLLRC